MSNQQPSLPLKTWGGKRRGAGRKPQGALPGVAHRSRPDLLPRFPVHVTIRLRGSLPTLRAHRTANVILGCLAAAANRFETRIVHYSLQKNHLHLILESANIEALARAAKGLSIRIAKAMNRMIESHGQVVPDRYDAHILKTPLEVKHALQYVLNNARKHLRGPGVRILWEVDPYSSGAVFDGWARKVTAPTGPAPPVSRAGTWLMRLGWRRHGLIASDAAPA